MDANNGGVERENRAGNLGRGFGRKGISTGHLDVKRLGQNPVKALAIALIIAGSLVGVKGIVIGVELQSRDQPLVLVNQLGYHQWNTHKEFLVQHDARLNGGVFQVTDTETGIVVVEGTLEYLGELWHHHYWKGDISSLNETGRYRVEVRFDSGPPGWHGSPVFALGNDVYDDALELGYLFYYYQRSGCQVIDNVVEGYPGHEACYMDDASFANGTYMNVTGGWFDAGDYNKYNGLTTLSVLALVEAYSYFPEFFNNEARRNLLPNSTGVDYHGDFPDILEEAIWGADFLARCTLPDGRLLSKIGSNEFHGHYGYWGPPEGETDNDPSTFEDNRRIHEEYAGWNDALRACLGLLELARLLEATGRFPARVATYRDAAWRLFDRYKASAGDQAILALINREWYLVNGSQEYLIESNRIGMKNLEQATVIRWGDPGFGHIGIDEPVALTLRWALMNGSSQVLDIARQRVADRLAGFWEPYTGSNDPTNFFNILKGRMTYLEYKNGTPMYTSVDEYFYDRFRDNRSDWNVGQNSYYLCAAWANLLAYKVSGNESHLYLALRMLDWVAGRNPFGLCMIEGVGTFNPPKYHNRAAGIPGNPFGKVPGAVPNGITRLGDSKDDPRLAEDLPYFDLRPTAPVLDEADYSSTEPWLPHNAYLILTLGTLLNVTSGS